MQNKMDGMNKKIALYEDILRNISDISSVENKLKNNQSSLDKSTKESLQ